jgi:hypothetical protein
MTATDTFKLLWPLFFFEECDMDHIMLVSGILATDKGDFRMETEKTGLAYQHYNILNDRVMVRFKKM